jgi:hypothetical protein
MVGTPVYDVFDSRGRIATITILDKTLEDLTVAVDQDGNIWRLKNKIWQKDFVAPDLSCPENSKGYERYCPEFKKLLLEQQQIAKQYFDSSAIQGKTPTFIPSEPSNYGRGHYSVPNMNKALIEYALKTSVRN